ncbi:MAG: hypothetical protein AAGF07_03700 [Patescibacteria group bacterium]
MMVPPSGSYSFCLDLIRGQLKIIMTPACNNLLEYISSKLNKSFNTYYYYKQGVKIPLSRGEMVTTQAQLAKEANCSHKTVLCFIKKYNDKLFKTRVVYNQHNRAIGTVFSFKLGDNENIPTLKALENFSDCLGYNKSNTSLKIKQQVAFLEKGLELETLNKDYWKRQALEAWQQIKDLRQSFSQTVESRVEARLKAYKARLSITEKKIKFTISSQDQVNWDKLNQYLDQSSFKDLNQIDRQTLWCRAQKDIDRIIQCIEYTQYMITKRTIKSPKSYLFKALIRKWDLASTIEEIYVSRRREEELAILEEEREQQRIERLKLKEQEDQENQRKAELQKQKIESEDKLIIQWLESKESERDKDNLTTKKALNIDRTNKTQQIQKLLDKYHSKGLLADIVSKRVGVKKTKLASFLATREGIKYYTVLGLREEVLNLVGACGFEVETVDSVVELEHYDRNRLDGRGSGRKDTSPRLN